MAVCSRQLIKYKNLVHAQQRYLTQNSSAQLLKTLKKNEENFGNNVTLKVVLKHMKGYELFMTHLCNEHSCEILLCLTEIIHFKQRMLFDYFVPKWKAQDMEIEDIQMSSDEIMENVMDLSEDIPQSMIVFVECMDPLDDLKCFRKIARLLWSKYICIGSEYEINISYGLRTRFNNLMQVEESDEFKALDHMQLFHLFDECCSVSLSFCYDSFQRFKMQPQFQQLCHLLLMR